MGLVIKNAKQEPKVYYGLHFSEGVAEYHTPDFDGRVLVLENAIRKMNPTFAGKPVYVKHVNSVNLEKLQEEADGYVIESFFNKSDGKHWVKFIVVSDEGHAAIAQGWKLSNAYHIKQVGTGGQWHAVAYDREVIDGEFEHLAIVPDPRYEESKVLTPEEFKVYNTGKEEELLRLANSKETGTMLKLFNRQKIVEEKAVEFANMTVELPKSKVERTLTQLVNEADEMEMKKNTKQYANEEHMVKVGENEMSVKELVNAHLAMKQEMAKEETEETEMGNESDESVKKKAEDIQKHEEEEISGKKVASSKEEDEKKAAQKNSKNFDKLKNAREKADAQTRVVEAGVDQLQRGKSRYGSA